MKNGLLCITNYLTFLVDFRIIIRTDLFGRRYILSVFVISQFHHQFIAPIDEYCRGYEK